VSTAADRARIEHGRVTIAIVMADTIETPQADPVVRFRLRTMLQATTVIAVLAAIAGPYYRSVDADAQRRLLIFWSMLMLCTGVTFLWRLREGWTRRLRTEARYVVYSTNGKSRRRRSVTRVFMVVALLGCYASASHNVATEPKRSTIGEVGESIYGGLFVGLISSAMLISFVRRPLFLTERGIPLATRHFVPWHWIHSAQWLPNQPNVMKLRRLAGDVLIEVSAENREQVEAFIREKIPMR
jgi:hypothetical protein